MENRCILFLLLNIVLVALVVDKKIKQALKDWKGMKLLLSTDALIIYRDNPKKFAHKLLELTREYNVFDKEVTIKKSQLHFRLANKYVVFFKIYLYC